MSHCHTSVSFPLLEWLWSIHMTNVSTARVVCLMFLLFSRTPPPCIGHCVKGDHSSCLPFLCLLFVYRSAPCLPAEPRPYVCSLGPGQPRGWSCRVPSLSLSLMEPTSPCSPSRPGGTLHQLQFVWALVSLPWGNVRKYTFNIFYRHFRNLKPLPFGHNDCHVFASVHVKGFLARQWVSSWESERKVWWTDACPTCTCRHAARSVLSSFPSAGSQNRSLQWPRVWCLRGSVLSPLARKQW